MQLLPTNISITTNPTSTTNVIDYLEWRGDLTLAQSEFNEVDGLILCIFSYLNLECARGKEPITIQEAAEALEKLPPEAFLKGPEVIADQAPELLRLALEGKRFSDMKLVNQVDIVDVDKELQFSAVTFLLSDGTAFLAIRGTDNTLVGWKEDFNMSFTDGVPAQLKAAKYVKNTLDYTDLMVRIGGHSKGGNLAVWAATHQSTKNKERILRIYNNDGPGFSEEFLKSAEYHQIRDKISAFVPGASAIGVMMAHDSFTTIQSSSPTLMSHAPFTWQVKGTKFIYEDERTRSGVQMEKLLYEWLNALTPEEREGLVGEMYEIIASTEVQTVKELDENRVVALLRMRKTFRNLEKEKQTQLLALFKKMLFSKDSREKTDLQTT